MRILSLLAVALAACYDPTVRDCQFTCPDHACPGDLTCTAGSCRVPGAVGSCAGAGTDAGPCPTPPTGCTLVTTTTAVCLATCSSPKTWAAAVSACAATGSWNLATLDTSNKLHAGEDAVKTPISWIGLTRSFPSDPWMWPSGSGSISQTSSEWATDVAHSGLSNLCAALADGKLYSDDCTTVHAYACTSS